MAKKKQEIINVPPELTISPDLQREVDQLIDLSKRDVVSYWDSKDTEYIFVPVDGGEIRVIHVKPEKPKNKQPIIHLPGWGVTPMGFNVLYEVLHEDYEFYYIETREKGSSRIKKRKANMTILQKAKDVQKVLDYLGLSDKDFVLFSPCWGATIAIEGIKENILVIPRLVTFDPMHKLWFNKFLIQISPIVPSFIVAIIKPILMFFAFFRMKEKNQLKRNKQFVKNAVIWKWKRAAYKAKDLELYGTLSSINNEILVFNGTTDKVHEQSDYPKLAKELPKGRFFFMKTDESNRERLQAIVMKEFANVETKSGIPPSLLQFEKELQREQ
ncbi:MAG: hypothetical protein JXA54_16485 [Candidatus Heimdallarchaeota archaeon]|nr:hypothetical protein [Candidatus Heimdallarchaeota archaeon]